jgi:hypothetical protein
MAGRLTPGVPSNPFTARALVVVFVYLLSAQTGKD